jgi:endonuclease/exonuclease/phosphatase (EEP) superfamily protein YafD
MRATRALSIAYFVAVVAAAILLALFGESWWPLTVLLYVPRVCFALPLFALVPANLWWRSWAGGAAAVAAAAIVLFPLMGLTLASPPSAHGPTVRVLSLNVYFTRHGADGILREIAAADPDIILLQAMSDRGRVALEKALRPRDVRADAEFLLATRYRVLDEHEPPRLSDGAGAGFKRYTIDTPLGPLAVFNMHPYSPRAAFAELRGQGLLETLRHGPTEAATQSAERNTGVRAQQLEALLAEVAAAREPVLVAGDSNLPGLGPLDRKLTERLADGFQSVGRGFGYTFPADRWWPWMRLDRILVGEPLSVVSFRVGKRGLSDHAPVIAEISRR